MQPTFHIKREQLRHYHIEHFRALNGGLLHFHSPVEIMMIHRGEAEVWVNDVREVIREGELAVVPSYASHQFRSPKGAVDCTDLFIPAFLCPDFEQAFSGKRVVRCVIRDTEATEKIRRAVLELERGEPNAIEQTGYIHVILGTVLRHITFEKGGTEKGADLPAQMLLYINEHFKEEISVSGIAQALGYSRNYLAECFRATFRVGISRYVNTVRLKNAVALMREKKNSITDCAMESGFSSLRTFYRVFEEAFGCAPRDYLKKE